MTIFAMRMVNMLLMQKVRRWLYLARDSYAAIVRQVVLRTLLVILWRLGVHLVLLAARRRTFTSVAAVVNVDLPAQVTVCETLKTHEI